MRPAGAAAEHEASLARQMAPPRRFEDLLRWFVDGYLDEVPGTIHGRGVWRDARHRGDTEGYDPVGGSALGAPRIAEGFRAYIEDDAWGTEPAVLAGQTSTARHYRTPMRAAVARLAGRGDDHDERPFMARALYRTALYRGDYDAALATMLVPEPVRRPYIEAALRRLWRRYSAAPIDRPSRDREEERATVAVQA